jgi:hypothetical protein
MSPLNRLVEPSRLLMTWQPSDEGASARTRRVIGEVFVDASSGDAVFRYLKGTSDFDAAAEAGFKGFPAFRLDDAEIRQGVLESLMRRLPPRNREDFDDFLRLHGLASPFELSDLALLGHTGARLPSDGFELVPEFPADAGPCDYVMEVAGTRHVFRGALSDLRVGDAVSIQPDPSNAVEADALAVLHDGERIGYVNRALKTTFYRWLNSGRMTATIERQNGKPNRPLVFVRVSVS